MKTDFDDFWHRLMTTNDTPLRQNLSRKEFAEKVWNASKDYVLKEIKNILDEKINKEEAIEKEIQMLIAGYLKQWEK
jgi:shikimate kinase